MQVVPVYHENTCSHSQTGIAFERDGQYLHATVWIVMRCLDCLQILDRKRLGRDRGRSGDQ